MYAGFEHTYVYKTISDEPISGKGYRFKFSQENYQKLKALDDISNPFDNDAYRETTFLMAYSRKTTEPLDRYADQPTSFERKERWFDVVIRVMEGTMTFYIEHMTRNRLKVNMTEIHEMSYEMGVSFYKMHWTVSGRGLFAMGINHTYQLGNAALNNCYATDVEKNLIKSCVWAMDLLCLGCGVGFSTKWNGKVVRPNKADTVLVKIPDSREGWCIGLEMLMRAYIPDKYGNIGKFPKFDYSLVRPYGSPIKRFGGTSSGPQPLRVLLERVEIFFDTYLDWIDGEYNEAYYVDKLAKSLHTLVKDDLTSLYETLINNKIIVIDKEISISKDYHDEIETLQVLSQTDQFESLSNNTKEAFFATLNEIIKMVDILDNKLSNGLTHNQLVYLNMFDQMLHRKVYLDTKFNEDQIRKEIYYQSNDPNGAYTNTRLVADIANAIGICIISGNVRRSSEILLGEPDDAIFLNLKNYMLHPLRRPIMFMSNNTVRLWTNDQFDQYLPGIAKRMKDNGEPGILNLMTVQKYGRFSDTAYGPDPGTLTNPCGEIILCPYEPCCLSVVAPTKCLDSDGNFDHHLMDNAVRWATLYAMIVTTIPHHWPATNKIIHRNRRIGVSLTGMVNFYERYGTTKTISICKSNYRLVRSTNKKYAAKMGIRESIRCTTSKPDGTIGIILGCSPGANFPLCKYAKRRVCYDKSNNLLKIIEKAGYEVEPSTLDSKQAYAIFPIRELYSRTERESSAFEKLAFIELIQRHYVDNSVSCTIAFNPATEGHLIEKAIAMHIPQLKCLAAFPQYDVLPGQYAHMPFENITEEKYNELIANVKQLDQQELYGVNHKTNDADEAITAGCNGGMCSINK